MAAIATDTVTISINEVELEVPKGELIVESVKRLGLEIPIFCYHPRMKPVGMCRMCIVEVGFKQPDGTVRKMPKPQAACTLPASEGMAVYTDSEVVHRDRKGVLEFLLINHPLDCPICDRGGECPLQNNTLFYGPSTSRYLEIKRHLPKAFPLSKYVTLDLERCIQCGRCVRFTEEISGDSQLAFRFRGAEMQPSTFELRDFDSKFSGNVIEICPVGALTSSEYRFRARPWDLETKASICTVCSNGCNIWFDHRLGQMVRINGRTNESINEEWTCDRGKFGHEFYNATNRLSTPFLRAGDKLVACEWADVYGPVLDAFGKGKGEVAAISGHSVSNEGLYLLQKLFRNEFKSNNLDSRFSATVQKVADRLESKLPAHAKSGSSETFSQVQTPIAQLESKKSILIFGTSLADDLPIVYLRVRKAWFANGCSVLVASSAPTDADSFAHLVLRFNPGTEAALARGLLAESLRLGKVALPEPMKKELAGIDAKSTERATGVPADRITAACELLDADSCIVTATTIWNDSAPQEVIECLGGLAMCLGAEFNCYPVGANEFGAERMGVLPDAAPGGKPVASPGLNTVEILQACAIGKIKALWLVGVDLFATGIDRKLVENALEKVPFLVVQDIAESETTAYASVVLPMTAPAEEDGTWTNCEGQVQRIEQVIRPKGTAKPAWRVFNEFMLRKGATRPYFNIDEVGEEIAEALAR